MDGMKILEAIRQYQLQAAALEIGVKQQEDAEDEFGHGSPEARKLDRLNKPLWKEYNDAKRILMDLLEISDEHELTFDQWINPDLQFHVDKVRGLSA